MEIIVWKEGTKIVAELGIAVKEEKGLITFKTLHGKEFEVKPVFRKEVNFR